MPVFACLIFEGEGGRHERVFEVNKDFQLYWGAIGPNLINLITLILTPLLLSTLSLRCLAPRSVLGSADVMGPLNLSSINVGKIDLLGFFCPSVIQKMVKCSLIERPARAGGCSGRHYGVLCRVKHSIGRQRAISPPLKAPVMDVKWPVCSCLEN